MVTHVQSVPRRVFNALSKEALSERVGVRVLCRGLIMKICGYVLHLDHYRYVQSADLE